MSVLGAVRQNWIMAIFGFYRRVGPPAAWETLLELKMSPWTSSVSSMVPPTFLQILMSFRSTLVAVLGSIIFSTASTAIGESVSE